MQANASQKLGTILNIFEVIRCVYGSYLGEISLIGPPSPFYWKIILSLKEEIKWVTEYCINPIKNFGGGDGVIQFAESVHPIVIKRYNDFISDDNDEFSLLKTRPEISAIVQYCYEILAKLNQTIASS